MAKPKLLKVKFVGGFLDGQKWKMRMPGEPVLPFRECRGVYELHDRGEDKKVYRFEYHYAEPWSEALERLPIRERYARLRRAVLSATPRAVWELGAPSRR